MNLNHICYNWTGSTFIRIFQFLQVQWLSITADLNVCTQKTKFISGCNYLLFTGQRSAEKRSCLCVADALARLNLLER